MRASEETELQKHLHALLWHAAEHLLHLKPGNEVSAVFEQWHCPLGSMGFAQPAVAVNMLSAMLDRFSRPDCDCTLVLAAVGRPQKSVTYALVWEHGLTWSSGPEGEDPLGAHPPLVAHGGGAASHSGDAPDSRTASHSGAAPGSGAAPDSADAEFHNLLNWVGLGPGMAHPELA